MGETTGPRSTGTRSTGESAAGAGSDRPEVLDDVDGNDLPTRVLVFGVARHDGTIPAADAFAVADACGRPAEQTRSCLRRLVAEGLFARDGVGQQAIYRPTDAGLRALSALGERARRSRAQDLARDEWDHRWHLVAFAVPEARRTARDALRDHLVALGGAAVHNGLYVSPRPWSKDVATAAADLDLVGHVTQASTGDLTIGGANDPRDLAARLWRLDELGDRYRSFLARWSAVPEALECMRRDRAQLPDTAFLPGALAMALAYHACITSDPLLPAELLPQPWPGRAARELLVRSRRLALEIRAEGGRPALFATFYDLVDGDPPDAAGPGGVAGPGPAPTTTDDHDAGGAP